MVFVSNICRAGKAPAIYALSPRDYHTGPANITSQRQILGGVKLKPYLLGMETEAE